MCVHGKSDPGDGPKCRGMQVKTFAQGLAKS